MYYSHPLIQTAPILTVLYNFRFQMCPYLLQIPIHITVVQTSILALALMSYTTVSLDPILTQLQTGTIAHCLSDSKYC